MPLTHVRPCLRAALRGLAILLLAAPAVADDASKLAAQAQNPIGAMISLPLESTFNGCVEANASSPY